jgi:hypothetical protein
VTDAIKAPLDDRLLEPRRAPSSNTATTHRIVTALLMFRCSPRPGRLDKELTMTEPATPGGEPGKRWTGMERQAEDGARQ